MTVRELFDMVKRYGLDPDASIYIKPLQKDPLRKAETLTTDAGKIILSASRPSSKRKR